MTIQSKNKQTKTLRIVLFISLMSLMLAGCAQSSVTPTPSKLTTNTPPPTRTLQLLPDLVVKSVSIDLESTNICDEASTRLWIYVQIENQGELNADPFDVDVNGTTKRLIAGLRPGEIADITFPFFQEQTTVWVDPSNQVLESDEDNNKFSQQLSIPTLSPECIQRPTEVVTMSDPIAVLEGHTAKVWSVDFSPNGKLLASGSIDNTLRLWQLSDAVLLRTMHGHPFPIHTIEFSPDGATLATGSSDGLIRIWHVSDGRLISTLEGHGGRLVDIDFSPDGKWLASCADDFTVRLWRLLTGKQVQVIDEGMASLNSINYSPDGELIAWAEESGTIRIWNIHNRNWLLVLNKSQPARSVTFSPNGTIIAAGYADGVVNIWNINTGNLIGTLQGHTDSVSSLSFSPDGMWLVSGSYDNTLRIWRIEEDDSTRFVTLQVLRGHTGPVNSIAISPNGKLIASGSNDQNILLWAIPEE